MGLDSTDMEAAGRANIPRQKQQQQQQMQKAGAEVRSREIDGKGEMVR